MKQALDAFKVGKGWKDMNTREGACSCCSDGVRHVITKVEKMLETSPTYAALLEEQAAKRAKAARKGRCGVKARLGCYGALDTGDGVPGSRAHGPRFGDEGVLN